VNFVTRTGVAQVNLSRNGLTPQRAARAGPRSALSSCRARAAAERDETVSQPRRQPRRARPHGVRAAAPPPGAWGGGGSAGSPRHVIKTILMKTISRVTGSPYSSTHAICGSYHASRGMIEALWVPAPATVAGRWRARRLNNACWGGGGSAGSLGSDLSSSAWLSRSLSCLASALRETSRSSRRRLPRTPR
jgi:hypothetical protein